MSGIDSIALTLAVRIIALIIFTSSLSYIVVKWLRKHPTRLLLKRTISSVEGATLSSVASEASRTIIPNLALQQFIAGRSFSRWFSHFLIFIGAMALLLFHGLPRIILGLTELDLFPWATIEIRIITHNIFLIMMITGVVISAVRRLVLKDMPGPRLRRYDLLPLALLTFIGVSGFLAWQLEYEPSLYARSDPILARGSFYITHMLIVYATIAALPLTKFFHGIVRLLSISVAICNKRHKVLHVCEECGTIVSSMQQVQDLKVIVSDVKPELFNLCPQCKRKRAVQE